MFSLCFCGLSPGTSASLQKPKTYKHNGSTGNSELSVVVRTKVGCLSVWLCTKLMACLGCTPTFALDSLERLQSSCCSHCRISSNRKQTDWIMIIFAEDLIEDLITWQHCHLGPFHLFSFWGNDGCDYSTGLSMWSLLSPLWPSCVISTDYGFFLPLKCSFSVLVWQWLQIGKRCVHSLFSLNW